MSIRNDRLKGMSYTEIGRKYNIDPRTAKKYAESDTRPEYLLTEPKASMLYPYKEQIDRVLRMRHFLRDVFLKQIKENRFRANTLNGEKLRPWKERATG